MGQPDGQKGYSPIRNNEKGYVWVLASLDKVYYFYRSSREGTFLKEMFEGFTGVLVSDFISAYESVGCLQQKCLLHFLRDVNEDLQKNPFDEEFKSFAREFASLLRRIIETIDKKGLSASCLSKHVPDARPPAVTGPVARPPVALGTTEDGRTAFSRNAPVAA
jgi:hypothetical protein